MIITDLHEFQVTRALVDGCTWRGTPRPQGWQGKPGWCSSSGAAIFSPDGICRRSARSDRTQERKKVALSVTSSSSPETVSCRQGTLGAGFGAPHRRRDLTCRFGGFRVLVPGVSTERPLGVGLSPAASGHTDTNALRRPPSRQVVRWSRLATSYASLSFEARFPNKNLSASQGTMGPAS